MAMAEAAELPMVLAVAPGAAPESPFAEKSPPYSEEADMGPIMLRRRAAEDINIFSQMC
jgi:hypothetical protein